MAKPNLKFVPKNDESEHNASGKLARIQKKVSFPVLTFGLLTVNILTLTALLYLQNNLWGQLHKLTQTEKEKVEAEVNALLQKQPENIPSVPGSLLPMDSFLVNIKSDQGPKYLQTQWELELADPTLEEEVLAKKSVIRNAAIVLLSSKTYKELREDSGMKGLRKEVLRTINNLLTTGTVNNLYFTKFHFN